MSEQKKTKRTPVAKPDRTFLVEKPDGKKFKLTVPAKYKVTFGPWAPPSNSGRGYRGDYRAEGTLRIYDGNTILAAFSPVVGFHDTSLDMNHLIRVEKGDATWEEDSEGNLKRSSNLLVENTWQDDGKEEGF